MLERDIASIEKRSVKLTIFFRPTGIWGTIKCWLGLDFPGPVLVEFEMNSMKTSTFQRRVRQKTVIRDEFFTTLETGRGKITVLMNPEDFNRRWIVRLRFEPLYN